MPQVRFDVAEQILGEAQRIAEELGLSIEDIARNALENYLDAARSARENDIDEPDTEDAIGSNVKPLLPANAEKATELDGTEPWLSTEADVAESDSL